MMDRLDNPSKIKAFELADELKEIMKPLCAKHQDRHQIGALLVDHDGRLGQRRRQHQDASSRARGDRG